METAEAGASSEVGGNVVAESEKRAWKFGHGVTSVEELYCIRRKEDCLKFRYVRRVGIGGGVRDRCVEDQLQGYPDTMGTRRTVVSKTQSEGGGRGRWRARLTERRYDVGDSTYALIACAFGRHPAWAACGGTAETRATGVQYSVRHGGGGHYERIWMRKRICHFCERVDRRL